MMKKGVQNPLIQLRIKKIVRQRTTLNQVVNGTHRLDIFVTCEATTELGARQLEGPVQVVGWLAVGVVDLAQDGLVVVRSVGPGHGGSLARDGGGQAELGDQVVGEDQRLVVGVQRGIHRHHALVQLAAQCGGRGLLRGSRQVDADVREHAQALAEGLVLLGEVGGAVKLDAGLVRLHHHHEALGGGNLQGLFGVAPGEIGKG